jgi:hypothetical protein
MSQTEHACPREQVYVHSRDSPSIDFAQASGKTASRNFWIEDIDSFCSNLLAWFRLGWLLRSTLGGALFAQLGELAA